MTTVLKLQFNHQTAGYIKVKRIELQLSLYKMPRRYTKSVSTHRGAGVINTLINKLPFEAHIPGYQFCGPGTKLTKRIARGDRGINRLDQACREHDLAYAKYPDNISERHNADNSLAKSAVNRVKSLDASLGERTAALGVAAAMKAKVKLGMGIKRRGGRKKRGRKKRVGGTLAFREVLKKAKSVLKQRKGMDLTDASKIAFKSINKLIKRKTVKAPTRVISVPKTGGILPLIPIFAGLSALGALSGGAAGIAKAVKDADAAKRQLTEAQRHNQSMEAIAMGKGLHLKPYKRGYGLYLSKNYQ